MTIGSTPLVVTQIGRYTAAGNSQTHIVKFVNADGSAVPGGSVSLSLSGAARSQFNCVNLPTPITLQANTAYILVSQEFSGDDQWYDIENLSYANGFATVNGGIYSDSGGHYVLVTQGNTYVPVNFTYSTVSSTPFLSGTPSAPLRNNYSGLVGMQIYANSTIQVNQLGRYAGIRGTARRTVVNCWIPLAPIFQADR